MGPSSRQEVGTVKGSGKGEVGEAMTEGSKENGRCVSGCVVVTHSVNFGGRWLGQGGEGWIEWTEETE